MVTTSCFRRHSEEVLKLVEAGPQPQLFIENGVRAGMMPRRAVDMPRPSPYRDCELATTHRARDQFTAHARSIDPLPARSRAEQAGRR